MNMFIFQIRIYCNNYSRLLQCQRHTNPDYKGSSLLIKHHNTRYVGEGVRGHFHRLRHKRLVYQTKDSKQAHSYDKL